MFLTTVRVRRARPGTLDHALTSRQLADIKDRRAGLAEVMCHGRAVAIVDAEAPAEPPLWIDPALTEHVSERKLLQLVRESVALMEAAKKAGLTTSEPATV